MKTSPKYICDICKREIEFEECWLGALAMTRTHYNVKLITCDKVLGDKQKPKKVRVDICSPCYRKMVEWILREKKD